jgi:hypothetical protein
MFCWGQILSFSKKKNWEFFWSFFFLSVNSINYSSFVNFSPTFPYRKMEAEKKKKKNRIGTGWRLRLAKRFSYKWYLTNSIEEIEFNMASMFPPSRSPSSV